jgi:hypothetical protein
MTLSLRSAIWPAPACPPTCRGFLLRRHRDEAHSGVGQACVAPAFAWGAEGLNEDKLRESAGQGSSTRLPVVLPQSKS